MARGLNSLSGTRIPTRGEGLKPVDLFAQNILHHHVEGEQEEELRLVGEPEKRLHSLDSTQAGRRAGDQRKPRPSFFLVEAAGSHMPQARAYLGAQW